MKILSIFSGKKRVLLLALLLLTFSLLSTLNMNMTGVTAVTSPYIAVDPANISVPTLTPGENFTVSIYTDYTGSDVWAWEFTLTYDPSILHGVAVANGDLISVAKSPYATFMPGTFDNTAGKLSLTGAFFFFIPGTTPFTTSGPGTLANVTFTVVGYGSSDIILGKSHPDTTVLKSPDTRIIDASLNPDQIGDGYFSNKGGEPTHDVHVVEVAVSNETHTNVNETIAGGNVTISVELRNEGTEPESVNVTVSYNTTLPTLIGFNDTFVLPLGDSSIVSFSWETPSVPENTTYTITAEVPPVTGENDTTDNNATTQIKLVTLHGVSVENGVEAPLSVFVGAIVSINVTVTNEGSFDENVTLTLNYTTPAYVVENIYTKNFVLKALRNNTVPFNWNTTGLDLGKYTITAKASIEPVEDDYGDNTETHFITLAVEHDVSIKINQVTPSTVDVGELATISVGVENLGINNETFVVKVTYNTNLIKNRSVNLLSGGIDSFTIDWNTAGVAPGSYNITAEAILDGDANLTNNRMTYSDPVVVNLPHGTIVGTVTDASTEEAIVGATVTANGHNATTDAEGHYTILDVPVGNYTVTVSADGYEDSSQADVIVNAGDSTSVNFTLRVIITITLSAAPTTISVGQNTNISGSISPAFDGVNITIQYRLSDVETWNTLTVTATENGHYSYIWTPETAGIYEFKAKWLGDESTSPAESDEQTVTVKEPSPSDIPWYLFAAVAVVVAITIPTIIYFLRIRKPKPT